MNTFQANANTNGLLKYPKKEQDSQESKKCETPKHSFVLLYCL